VTNMLKVISDKYAQGHQWQICSRSSVTNIPQTFIQSFRVSFMIINEDPTVTEMLNSN